MEFTKELVHQNWLILIGSSTPQLKSKANIYLTAFKKCPNVIQISTEIFLTEKDNNIRFLATLLIYQHIKENICTIMLGKESFNQCKHFLLSNLFPHLNDCSQLVQSNVCQSITIIVLVGSVTYWFESIDDLIQMASVSEEYSSYAIMILENCHKELTEMAINPKEIMKIKTTCVSHSNMIKAFIINFLGKMQSYQAEKIPSLFKHLLELTCSWIKFKVNILSIPNFPQMLFNELVKNNRSIIAEILSDSFTCSSTSINALTAMYPNEKIISVLESKAEKGELDTIYQIIEMIQNLYTNYSNRKLNYDEEELLYYTAIIFSSLCKEYVYLFFTNNDTGELMMNLFLYFIAHSKRKISYLFFDSLEKMKGFLIQQHLYSDIKENDDNGKSNKGLGAQKEKFMQFLLKVDDSILKNVQLEKLTVNYEEIIHRQNLQDSHCPGDLLTILEEEEDNIQKETEDLTINFYRKTARDAFGEIFIIIIENYSQQGIQNYLTRKGDMLIKYNNNPINPNDSSILSNQSYLLFSEAILFSIRQIKYCFDLYTIDKSMLANFAKFILDSQLILNEKMLVNTIIFLYAISDIISIHQDLYVKSIQFLLSQITKNKVIEKASAMIILEILTHSKEMNQEVYGYLSNYYINGYHHLDMYTLGNICTSLMKSVINNPYTIQKDIAFNVMIQIMTPVTESFNSIDLNSLTINTINEQNILKLLIKNFTIYTTVVKYIGSISKEILNDVFNQTNSIIFKYSNGIISLNTYHKELILPILTLYTSICLNLKEYSLAYFDQINNIIFTIYSKDKEEYQVIYLMKSLYHEALKQKSSPQCQMVIEKLCVIISQIYTTCISIQYNQLETMELFSSFLVLMLDNIGDFPNNSFDWDIMNKVAELLINSNHEIIGKNINQNIMKVMQRICSCQGIPMNFKISQLDKMINGVFCFIDCYDMVIMKEIRTLIIEIRKIDRLLLENRLMEIFGKEIGMIVNDYCNAFCNDLNKEKIDKLLYELAGIKKGKIDKSVINHYAIEVKAFQRESDKFKR